MLQMWRSMARARRLDPGRHRRLRRTAIYNTGAPIFQGKTGVRRDPERSLQHAISAPGSATDVGTNRGARGESHGVLEDNRLEVGRRQCQPNRV